MDTNNPESEMNLDESTAFASSCYSGMELVLKAFDEYHGTIETTLQKFPKNDRVARDKALFQLWLRTYAWLQSAIKLNQPRDYQAVATACRAVFELLVDVALIYKSDGEGFALMMLAYADSEKLEVCKRRIEFFKEKGITTDPVDNIPARFYAESRDSIEAIRKHWWGKAAHPRRWTGVPSLREDALEVHRLCGNEMSEDLSMPIDQFYLTEYKKLNWHIHSGLASTWNMPAETYNIWAAFCFRWLGEFAFLVAKMILIEIQMTQGVPDIREHWKAIKNAQRKEFTDKMSEFLENVEVKSEVCYEVCYFVSVPKQEKDMTLINRLRSTANAFIKKPLLSGVLLLSSLVILSLVGYVAYQVYIACMRDGPDGKSARDFLAKAVAVVIIGVVLGAIRNAISSPSKQDRRATPASVNQGRNEDFSRTKPRMPNTSSILWLEAELENLYENMFADRRPPKDKSHFLQTFPLPLLNEIGDEVDLPIVALESAVRTMVQETRSRIGSLEVPLRNVQIIYAAGLPDREPAHIEFGSHQSILRIDSIFRDDPFGICAILCHELAHFVMDQNSLRKVNISENEKLTDLFVFACGQGRISLQGILCDMGEHRGKLGYLTVEEMAWAFVRTAFHRGMDRSAIIAACYDREIAKVVTGVLEFLTIKEGKAFILAEIVICPSKHILRFNPERTTVRCPRCGWKSRVWHRREDYRAFLVDKGQIALSDGKYELALEQLRLAQSVAPRHSLSYCVAAQCLKKLGRHQEAIREIRKILTISPDDKVAQAAMQTLLYV